ncbi:hypothetical protein DYB32_003792, partial [Aphanomyces invadans]
TSILKRLQGDAATVVAMLLQNAATTTAVDAPIQAEEDSCVLYGHLSPAPAPPLKATTVHTVDQPSVVMPSCSRWFSLHSIHPIEKRMLPEFFQNNKAKTPTHGMPLRKLDAWGVRPGSGVCAACFVSRKFPSHLDPSDFIALFPVSATPWTTDEKLCLLNTLNKLDTSQQVDWNDVAQAVGRPAKECIAQFLKTPLEPQTPTPVAATRRGEGMADYPHVTAVPDLASIVASADPTLAKAAANAAVAQLDELNLPSQQQLKSSTAAANANKVSNGPAPSRHGHQKFGWIWDAAVFTVDCVDVKKGIAKYEDGVVKGLMSDLVQCQMQHIQLKLHALEQLEAALQAERDQVAKERYEIYVDKLNMAQAKLAVASSDE